MVKTCTISWICHRIYPLFGFFRIVPQLIIVFKYWASGKSASLKTIIILGEYFLAFDSFECIANVPSPSINPAK